MFAMGEPRHGDIFAKKSEVDMGQNIIAAPMFFVGLLFGTDEAANGRNDSWFL